MDFNVKTPPLNKEQNLRVIQTLDMLERAEQNIASLLVKNENLFKLLRFADTDPLSHEITDEEIEEMLQEYNSNGEKNDNCRVFFEPFTDETLDDKIAMLRIYPSQMNPQDVYIGDLYLQADIIVHQSISKIVGGRRRNRILSELLQSINGQEIKLVQRLMLVDRPIALRQFYDLYWGYSLLLKTAVSAIR